MCDIHRQSNEIAAGRRLLFTVQQEIETAFEHVDEFILSRMDMRRNEGGRRKGGVPGKRAIRQVLRQIRLTEDIPNNAVNPSAGLGDACAEHICSLGHLSISRMRQPTSKLSKT